MSTTTAHEVRARTRPRAKTLRADFANHAAAVLEEAASQAWPSEDYAADPVRFSREVLGAEPYDAQIEIAEAVRDHKRVAVSSGHKVGKSYVAAWLALWFYCSFPEARVVMSSTTSRQVDQILWREVRRFHKRATVPIGGDLHELARSGLKADDFREIVGFTAREAEAVAGISGAHLLYVLDEASGIPDEIFEAIEGNRAGGARLVMFSNPTRTEGEFYEAFFAKAAHYRTFRLSSEDTPNVREGRVVVPGLAVREWIDEKREEWGEDSPLYKIRVKGEHVLSETGKIISVHLIGEAEARWYESIPSDDDRLFLGIDPAGPGHAGDETAIAVRRGKKILAIYTWRGLDESGILAHALGVAKEFRRPREIPVFVVDREGPIGVAAYGFMRAHAATHGDVTDETAIEVFGVRSSDKAIRQPHLYDRVRDELWANLVAWLRDDGAIPEDTKLAKELHAPEWVGQITGKLKATPKADIKAALGRSPDRADACALAAWTPTAASTPPPDNGAPTPSAPEPSAAPSMREYSPRTPSLDPYAGAGAWGGRRR